MNLAEKKTWCKKGTLYPQPQEKYGKKREKDEIRIKERLVIVFCFVWRQKFMTIAN